MSISTPQSVLPILCPMEVFHISIPKTYTIYIENHSLLAGCFYFLSPFGDDLTRLTVDVTPKFGTVKPLKIRKIKVTITCLQVGIFENYFVSCFVGIDRPAINLRVMAIADYTYVYFYLPNKRLNEYRNVLWPQKIIYEREHEWNYCICMETINHRDDVSQNSFIQSIESPKDDLVKFLKAHDKDYIAQKQVVQLYDIPLRKRLFSLRNRCVFC